MSFVILEPVVAQLYAVAIPSTTTVIVRAASRQAVERYMSYFNSNYPEILVSTDPDGGQTFYQGSVVRRSGAGETIQPVEELPRELRRLSGRGSGSARPRNSRFATLRVCEECNGLIPEECECSTNRARTQYAHVRRFSAGRNTAELMLDRGDF